MSTGLRVRPLKKLIDNDLPPAPVAKKKPMTSAERSQLYRERLKLWHDYKDIQETHRQRNLAYKAQKCQNETDEEKAARRKATAERVRKHREKKKDAQVEQVCGTANKVLTINQRETKRKRDRERKAEERQNWTPQKWRRHREKCRIRYHATKKEKTPPQPEQVKDSQQARSQRSLQRAYKQVSENLPKDNAEKRAVINKLLRVFCPSVDDKENGVRERQWASVQGIGSHHQEKNGSKTYGQGMQICKAKRKNSNFQYYKPTIVIVKFKRWMIHCVCDVNLGKPFFDIMR